MGIEIGWRSKNILPYIQFNTRIRDIEKSGAGFYYVISSTARTFGENDLFKDFFDIPEFNYALNLKARMKARMKLELRSIKTGEPIDPAKDKLAYLFTNPNWFQTMSEYIEQASIFMDLDGNKYHYCNFPLGFNIQSTKAMFILPSQYVECKTPDERPFFQILEPDIEYTFKWGTDTYKLDKDNVIHLNTNRINMQKEKWVRGQSAFIAIKPALNNIRGAYESRGIIIDNRGAEGMISANSVNGIVALPGMKDDIQEALKKYGDRKGQHRMMVVGHDVKYNSFSRSNPSNLGLFEEVLEDSYKIFDTAGIDADLMAQAKGATFENKKWAERRTYENTIIPESIKDIEAWNSAFDFASRGQVLVGTFDHLSCFSETEKERLEKIELITGNLNQWLTDGAITIQEYRRIINEHGLMEAMQL